VRADYEKALTLAKEHLGPVLPEATPVTLDTDWRHAPLIKARLAGGYCVRALAQGTCVYTNICEHCPNYRTDATFFTDAAHPASRCEVAHGRCPSARLGGRSRPPPPADRPTRPAHLGRPLGMSDPVTRVEAACAALADAGAPVTFTAVAARAGVAKATLYRRPELRAVVEERRIDSREAHTLSGLVVEIDHLRQGLEAVAAKVRRHEEEIRALRRRSAKS
jgi:hypothetical protein